MEQEFGDGYAVIAEAKATTPAPPLCPGLPAPGEGPA
jgi:hypothetical protein